MKYYCNPLNVPYRYQFAYGRTGRKEINREAADPSLIRFRGKYYMFVSMNLSVWVSEDLASWQSVRLPENLPLYDYAPDVRVIGDYVYFSASKREENCSFSGPVILKMVPTKKSREHFLSGTPICFRMMTEGFIFTGAVQI